jgi:hypothetical protein
VPIMFYLFMYLLPGFMLTAALNIERLRDAPGEWSRQHDPGRTY